MDAANRVLAAMQPYGHSIQSLSCFLFYWIVVSRRIPIEVVTSKGVTGSVSYRTEPDAAWFR